MIAKFSEWLTRLRPQIDAWLLAHEARRQQRRRPSPNAIWSD